MILIINAKYILVYFPMGLIYGIIHNNITYYNNIIFIILKYLKLNTFFISNLLTDLSK